MTTRTIAPHSPDVEVSVLGSMMQDAPAAELALRELRPLDFFDDRHRQIFSTFASLSAGGAYPDELVLIRELVKSGKDAAAGGSAYVYGLRGLVPTAGNIAKHVEILRHEGQLRRIILECTDAAERARMNGTDPAGIVADLWEKLRSLDRKDADAGPILLKLSDVASEAVTWLWPGRLPLGKLSMVVGDPGLGKSFLTLDIASRISRGGVFPDGTQAPLGNVILLTAEDGIADTIRGRVDALEGDPSRIHVLAGIGDPEKPKSFSLADDVAHLEDAILRTRACLVVVDPLSAYLAGVDSHKDADVRGILAPLAAMAERNRVAVVCIIHMNKSQQRQALYRAQGSLAFVAAARAVFGVCEDQGEPGRRLLVPMKMNLAPKPPGLAFRIDTGRLVWADGVVDVNADEAMGGEDARGERAERREATDFLREALANGSEGAAEVKAQAKAAGISDMTLRRARSELGVTAYKVGYPGVWMWALAANSLTTDPSNNREQDRTRSEGVSKIEVAHHAELAHDPDHISV